MKKVFLQIGIGLLIALIVSSCAIEKRKFTNGFTVFTSSKNETEQIHQKQIETYQITEKPIAKIEEQNDKEIKTVENANSSAIENQVANDNINEAIVNSNEVVIKNGKGLKTNESSNLSLNSIFTLRLTAKAFGLSASSSSDKSQLVALILAIFLGGLGIHRFYLGYTGIGIIQLLTAGGCGIWALIDIIRIAIGDLGPKNGSYDKTL